MTAKIIADSVSAAGARLTTMEVRMHRFVLAEFNTHRVFSRNSASSRAIPFEKQVERVIEDPAIPVTWASEKKGMQGGDEIHIADRSWAEVAWRQARMDAVTAARSLAGLNVHKSIVNRLLEPFMWHTVIVTSTTWHNFFTQRCSELAQPEIRVAAEAMREALEASSPTPIEQGKWHLPYTDSEDYMRVYGEAPGLDLDEAMRRISAARCARVSYLTHDGTRSIEADLTLYDRLVSAKPGHWSPLEHVATPCPRGVQRLPGDWSDPAWGHNETHRGNFEGWDQLRHKVDV